EAAVGAGVAPAAAPVVVVQAGAVAGEVLGEEYVGQVVATGAEAGDADGVAVHRLVGDAPQNGEYAGWGGAVARAFDGQERVDRVAALVDGHAGRHVQVDVQPAAGVLLDAVGCEYRAGVQVVAIIGAIPQLAILALHR